MSINKDSKIYIAGHSGLIGSAVTKKYKQEGYRNILTKTHSQLDLTRQDKVDNFFLKEKPEYVILVASRVGGIRANMTHPSEFLYENSMIYNNIIWSSLKNKVKKLLFISCGCAYPYKAKQPMKEEYILSGPPEPTNEGFAIAKFLGMKLCEKINIQYGANFVSCIPANSYGVNDHFEEEKSHVIPALIKKMHRAKLDRADSITLWGTGKAVREFIYADDLAEGIFLVMEKYSHIEPVNIGSGEGVTISHLAELVKDIVGYKGKINYDTTKPDGMQKRLLDSSKIKKLGFKCRTPLSEGLRQTYEYFL